MSPDPSEREQTLALVRYLGAQLLPLALVLFSIVATAAPLAIFSLRMDEYHDRANATAHEVADWIRREARERPELWKYDTLKIVAQLQAYGSAEDVRHIAVTDSRGQPIDVGVHLNRDALRSRDILWGRANVVVDTENVGEVWVAMAVASVRHNALVLLGAFGALGAVLAGFMYALPLRAMGTAETRIQALVTKLESSRQELHGFNRTLGDKVAERSSELQAAYAALQAKEHHLRELSTRAIALQEAERRAIARELHDSAGQALTAIRIHLQLLATKSKPGDAIHELAEKTLTMADGALEEIRRAVRNLGPAILDDFGLTEAVSRYLEDFRERTRMEIDVNIDLAAQAFGSAVESACYRIIQETLTNVSRHAAATHVSLHLTADGRTLSLIVADDGVGFDPRAASGHGLVGIHERVELLGGTVAITSAPGLGSRIHILLPLTGGRDV